MNQRASKIASPNIDKKVALILNGDVATGLSGWSTILELVPPKSIKITGIQPTTP